MKERMSWSLIICLRHEFRDWSRKVNEQGGKRKVNEQGGKRKEIKEREIIIYKQKKRCFDHSFFLSDSLALNLPNLSRVASLLSLSVSNSLILSLSVELPHWLLLVDFLRAFVAWFCFAPSLILIQSFRRSFKDHSSHLVHWGQLSLVWELSRGVVVEFLGVDFFRGMQTLL